MRMILILTLSFCLILTACYSAIDFGDNETDNLDTGETEYNDTSETDTTLDGSNSITLKWSAPIQNVDSSCTDDLSGYEIHYGTTSKQYTDSTQLSVADVSCTDSTQMTECGTIQICTYTLTELPADTWYLAVSANDWGGNRSLFSNEIIRVVTN